MKQYVDASKLQEYTTKFVTKLKTIFAPKVAESYYSDVTTLAITFPDAEHYEMWIKLSTAASGTVAITFPASAKFIGAEPVFGNDETWEISIKDGVVVAGMVE